MAKVTPIQVVIENMIKRATEEAILPWHKPWQSLQVRQQNLTSGHQYSGVNLFLLMTEQRSPFFATAANVRKLGGSLVDNAIPYPIVFYKPIKRTDKRTGEETKSFMLRYYTVYNHADMVDITAPEADTDVVLKEHEAIAQCELVVNSWEDRPTIQHGGDRAYYMPSADIVQMPKIGQFDTAAEYYCTLFHELAHSTGHKSRLDRDMKGGSGSLKYSREELVAELTACLLRVHCQIDNPQMQDNSVAYLQNWSERLTEEPTMFTYAAAKAQAAFNMIIGV